MAIVNTGEVQLAQQRKSLSPTAISSQISGGKTPTPR